MATSVVPSTGVTATQVTLRVLGARFTAESVIYWETTPLATTLVSANEVRTTSPQTLPAAGVYDVTVKTGDDVTAAKSFTVTATGELMSDTPVDPEPEPTEPEPEPSPEGPEGA